ncbi:S8 family peptidase [Hyphomonas sp.]|uniref:S8 family peptidase n=1 Tax=Hyphomonas sp. TaxID=87 RepID=UPI00391DFA04
MADPKPYLKFLASELNPALKFGPIRVRETSSFLIETVRPMWTGEVQERMLAALQRGPARPELPFGALQVETLRAGTAEAEDLYFLVDLFADPSRDRTAHARAAIAFAEWLEQTEDWIRQAKADFDWHGRAAPGLKSAESAADLCSAGAPPPDHDWHWGYARIRAGEALDLTQRSGKTPGGQGTRIGHVDTGYSPHVELDGTYDPHSGHDFILKTRPGRDPMNYDGTPGHGGSTASVMVSPVRHRIKGVAPLARTVPYRAIKHVAVLTKMSRVAQAIRMAADDGCDVVSMSLGGLSLFSGLEDALRYARSKHVILIAAAGNCVGITVAPAISANCIAVSGVRGDDRPWQFASRDIFGNVDIAAPAQWVLAARPGDGTNAYSDRGEGTSYAAAMTAGAAALWLAHHGREACREAARTAHLSLHDYFCRLLRSTARTPPDWPAAYGVGILDCFALLDAGLPADPGPSPMRAGSDDKVLSSRPLTDKQRFEQVVAAL